MNIKTYIYFTMLCCLPLLASCGAKQKDMPGEKYKTLTVTTTNQTYSLPTRHTARKTICRHTPASERHNYQNLYQ